MGKSAITRLTEQLDQKDARIEELEDDLRKAEQRVEQAESGWTMHTELGKVEKQKLPLPRLEMVFEPSEHAGWADYVVLYRLVYAHYLGHAEAVPLGKTHKMGSGRDRVPLINSKPDLPIRDGAHICHDAAHMKLPAFVVIEGKSYPQTPGWWSCQCPACSEIRASGAPMGGR